MRSLAIVAILGLCAVGWALPSKKEKKVTEIIDDSDRELIRVARGDVDEDDVKPRGKLHRSKKRSTEESHNKRSKRAAEEDAFFQALLTRASGGKKEKKRSFDEGADNKGYIIRDDWKGDSKISDADRQELENLFNAINSPDEGGEEKVEETRSLKPGLDGKVQQFIDWLMSQPPDKFTRSLSHILDVEASLTKMFYDGQKQQQDQQLQQSQQDQQQQQTQQQDVAADPSKASSQPPGNCKTKCYTIQLGNTECKIICEPPRIEQPTVPAYGFYPQQTGYAQQYPAYPGQVQTPCVPPNCPPNQMYGTQYPVQGYAMPAAYPAPGLLPQQDKLSPVNEGCVGRSCDEKKLSQSDKPPEEKPVKQDKPAPSPPKPAPANAPYSFQTPGATIIMDPVKITSEPEPQIPMAPMIPGQLPMPLAQPYVVPPQMRTYDSYSSVPALPQPQPVAAPAPYFQPMPSNCNDYSEPRCRVFLDWPTNERDEIRASLRFKQNWHSDFKNPSSTKYKIMRAEVEKAIKDVYTQDPGFNDVRVTGFSEEDLKVAANFILSFKRPESGALRFLSRAISNNYLQSMPVYKNTLLRDGITHHHRSIVTTQKEIDAMPKVKVESSHKHDDEVLTTESESYQGCFRDKKPDRDLPKQFTKYEMTPDWCVARCKLAGFTFAGVQYGYLCFCGNDFGKYGRSDDGKCDSLCFGDKTRTCGSFWHNSIFSVDGKKHDVAEFRKLNDKEDSGSGESEDDEEPDVPEHTEVANHLMKAAEAALRAAKKLLPYSSRDKPKRTPEEELQLQQENALKSLNAAETLMNSKSVASEHKEKEKRTAEGDGRDLLVAYLSDVGGYDRTYRDVEDEDESGSSQPKSKNEKFEYRRMVIDESGDGEFIQREQNKELKARKRREVTQDPWEENFDGPKKMASRAAPAEEATKRNVIPVRLGDTEDDTSRLGDTSGDADKPEGAEKPAESEESGDGWEEEESGESDDGGEGANSEESGQSGFTDESEESGESGQSDESLESGDEEDQTDSEESGFAREIRETKEGDKQVALTRHRRELSEKIDEEDKAKSRSKRQSAMFDDGKLKTMEEHVQQGAENIMSLIVDIYQSHKSLDRLQQFVQQLKQDVMQQLNVPEGQKDQALKHLRDTVKQTVIKKVNELAQSIRQEVQDYKQSHQAVSQQAKEAVTAILDLPVFQDKVSNLKSRIKKRAVEIEKEYKKAKRGSEELPSILKEHFKRNAPDLKGEKRLSRSHRDLNL